MRTFTVQFGRVVMLLAILCVVADSVQAGPFRNRRAGRHSESSNCDCGTGGYGSQMYSSGYGNGGQMYSSGYGYGNPGAYTPYNGGPSTSFYTPSGTVGGGVPTPMPSREVTKIRFVDGAAESVNMTIPVGTTVRWINDSKQPHSVTSINGDWDSGEILPGKEYSAVFNQPGTFEYSSRFQKGLKGTIVVK